VFSCLDTSYLFFSYQKTYFSAIPLTFTVVLGITLIAVQYLSRRLSNSVKKVSDMMLEMANLNLSFNRKKASRTVHLKETERLLTAMETMDVALRSFVKYVPQEVVRILIRENSEVVIGVDDSFLTIFFSDIENFTTITETLDPSLLIQVMSEYLEEMSQIILESSGVVDKYIGDAIMAFWNAPLPVPSHRAVACAAALRCQRRLNKLNTEWSVRGIPRIRTRIGLNAGMALVGNLGSPTRMSYTCIGDSINTASRLEGINKQYGTYLIISENVYQSQTVQENFLCRPLDFVCLKGKSQPLTIYELVCELKLSNEEMKEQVKLFEDAFGLFRKREFANAGKLFSEYLRINPDDTPARLLKQRCVDFMKAPPPPDWNGAHVAVEK